MRIGILTPLCLAICFLMSCRSYNRNRSHDYIPGSSIDKGEQLAHKYCQSCHAFTEPSMLDATTWEKGVLPSMGPRLGIFKHLYIRYPVNRNDKDLDSNFYPAKPVISSGEWQNILDYYTATSPDSVELGDYEAINANLPFFKVETPEGAARVPATTFIKIIPSGGSNSILLGDLGVQSLYKIDSQLKAVDSLPSIAALADIDFKEDKMMLCDMVHINPSSGKFGRGYAASIDSNGKMIMDSVAVLKGLARPVQITSADLDADGLVDYTVCEFGFMAGALTWFKNLGNGTFKRYVISSLPGAIKLYVQDQNKDGLPDLWVLFAQGEEGVFLFTNRGDGRFEQKQVLRFPPVYGSTSFELIDFNKDGHQDIVYTCGDNADYSQVLKPYHGVYIFINDGQNSFRQQYFFHINGCYKAIANDYDKDGDMDIAVISFFADYVNRPGEGFVYLENKGRYVFTPYSFAAAKLGRWLTMDAGDFDGDGYTDLVLGNFSIAPTRLKSSFDWKKGPPFLVLKNIGKK